ncbi:TlpA family protein disulfide reductase [Shewanella sp. JL219SE-S6]
MGIQHDAFTPKLSKLLIVGLLTPLLSVVFGGQASAEDDFAAEGERRAKLAGSELIGTPAPQRELTTLTGETLNLQQLYGSKPVYIKFWATWCVPCRQQMPGFEKIYQQYGEKLQVIAVNTGISDDINSVGAFVKQAGLNIPVVIDDGALARAFKLRVTPQHFLVDRSGRIAYVGHQDDEAFHQALEAVIADKGENKAPLSGTVAEKASGYEVGDKFASLRLKSIANISYPLPSTTRQGKATGLVFFAPGVSGTWLNQSRIPPNRVDWCGKWLSSPPPMVSLSGCIFPLTSGHPGQIWSSTKPIIKLVCQLFSMRKAACLGNSVLPSCRP